MSETRRLQFVDTNILVYAHDTSSGAKHARARQLVNSLWRSEEGCLSIQVLQELFVTLTRKVAIPIAPGVAADIIAQVSRWHVHSPDPTDVLRAIDLSARRSVSFWDAMIIVSARQMDCSSIWSEDMQSGQTYVGVQIRNPFLEPPDAGY